MILYATYANEFDSHSIHLTGSLGGTKLWKRSLILHLVRIQNVAQNVK